MDDVVRSLLAKQRYLEAARALDGLLMRNADNDELWYLRGIVSLKLKGYDSAHECFERALFIRKRPEYYRVKGMAHFEIFELEEAADAFLRALALDPRDAESEFFAAICYMLMEDPRATGHMKRAQELDAARTVQLLSNFYSFFIEKDQRAGDAQKKALSQMIRSLKK
jgi:tetratricopeptide (TPR) repeat protein